MCWEWCPLTRLQNTANNSLGIHWAPHVNFTSWGGTSWINRTPPPIALSWTDFINQLHKLILLAVSRDCGAWLQSSCTGEVSESPSLQTDEMRDSPNSSRFCSTRTWRFNRFLVLKWPSRQSLSRTLWIPVVLETVILGFLRRNSLRDFYRNYNSHNFRRK
jgi:hypothetical protein